MGNCCAVGVVEQEALLFGRVEIVIQKQGACFKRVGSEEDGSLTKANELSWADNTDIARRCFSGKNKITR